MKALKIIGGVIGSLVLIVLILGLFAPTETHVERSVVINAPKDFVWERMNTLAAMQRWSPWVELDPTQETTFEGEDGAVGSIMHWKGNDQVGSGSQEIISAEDGNLRTKLMFIEPFESEAEASLTVTEENGQTTATWGFDGVSAYPMNVMNLFMNMDDMLGPDFEKGVNKLKEIVETDKTTRSEFNGFTITMSELPATTYYGLRATTAMADMHAFFSNGYATIGKTAGKAKVEPTGVPAGLYYTWDETAGSSDMMAAMPFAEGTELAGLTSATVGGKALKLDYIGPYEGSAEAHAAMDAYMGWHGLKFVAPVVEQYVNDPSTEPDPAKLHTVIYYMVE